MFVTWQENSNTSKFDFKWHCGMRVFCHDGGGGGGGGELWRCPHLYEGDG